MQNFVHLIRRTGTPQGVLGGGENQWYDFEPWKLFELELKQEGGRLIHGYGTMGQFDAIVETECPTVEAMAKVVLRITQQVPVTIETLYAIPAETFSKVVSDALSQRTRIGTAAAPGATTEREPVRR